MIESEYLKNLVAKAKKLQKTIVLPEGEDERILKAAHIIAEEEAANLVILGDETEIKNYFAQNNWSMNRISIVAPETSPKLEEYANLLYELRKAKGMTPEDARKTARDANYFGSLLPVPIEEITGTPAPLLLMIISIFAETVSIASTT